MENLTLNLSVIHKSLINSTNGLIEDPSEEWSKRQVALIIILGIIIAVTVTVNSFVLYIFIVAKRRLRNPTNLLLANLAVADLLVGVVVMPLLASLTILDKWIFGDLMCQAFDYIHFPLCGASMWSMIGIGVDRLIGVTRPLQYRNVMTRKKTAVMIGMIWLAALTMTAGPLTYWPKRRNKMDTVCEINLEKYFLIFVIFFVYWIPIGVTFVIYCFLYKIAKVSIKKFPCNRIRDETTEKVSEHRRLARRISVVTGAIFLFYAPVFIVFTIKAYELAYYSGEILLLSVWIRYCCSTVNPFMYALAVPGFKQEIKERLFGIRDKRGQMEESLTQSYIAGSEAEYKEDSKESKILNCKFQQMDRFCTQCGFLIGSNITVKNARCVKCHRKVLCSSWTLPEEWGTSSFFMCPHCPTIRFFDGVGPCFCQNCNHKFEPLTSQQPHEKLASLTTIAIKPCQQIDPNRENINSPKAINTRTEMLDTLANHKVPGKKDIMDAEQKEKLMDQLRTSAIAPYLQRHSQLMLNQSLLGDYDNTNSITLEDLDEIVLQLVQAFGINVITE